MLPAYFDPVRARLAAALQAFLRRKASELEAVDPRGSDAVERLREFCLRGKMMRGCLVHLGWCLGEGDSGRTDAVTDAGAAMELFQSGLLVHDDIMDRDAVRRGQPSLYRRYEELAGREGLTDPPRVGEALGICAGDVAYFMAFELLGHLPCGTEVRDGLVGLCARELSAVGIAQMQDVSWGASPSPVDAQQIVRMYRYKTGRYSFSLPLLAGARLAGAPGPLQRSLELCGECLGVLFQIRDDALGLFGDTEEIGKPAGSDVREGKKTVLFSVLADAAGTEDRRRLGGILGNPRVSEGDLRFIRELASSDSVKARMRAFTDPMEDQARREIDGITSGAEEDRAALRWLLDFSTGRRQ